jgi:NAD(P)-dependent dehydrogenase (short-subunit alcohol dehydrogenase family)
MSVLPPLLSGKTVVIVGGAGLIGQAFAEGLLRHSAQVVIADIDAQRCQSVCERLAQALPGASIAPETVDITSKASLRGLIERVTTAHGKVDTLVNNAYPRNRQYGRRLEEVEYSDFCENVSLHLGGYFLSTQQFAEHFKVQGFGHVINISSIYGTVAPRFDIYDGTSMTMPVEYAAIKSALQHLSLYFMRYYKGTTLRFNCLSPGGILDRQPEAFLEAYKKYSQSKGMLKPEDMIGSLVYLVSDLSACVNGQNLIVDDGWSV